MPRKLREASRQAYALALRGAETCRRSGIRPGRRRWVGWSRRGEGGHKRGVHAQFSGGREMSTDGRILPHSAMQSWIGWSRNLLKRLSSSWAPASMAV